jgi:hypothetical protein
MEPLQTDRFWKERIKAVKAVNLKWGAERIRHQLQADGGRLGRKDYPSARTVGRILKNEWEELPEADRAEYRVFYWPESMESEDLPWEASSSALELLHFHDSRVGIRERPLVRLVRWFWRVSQAAPGCPIYARLMAAQMLTSHEVGGGQGLVRGVEWFLAYRPWDGETGLKAYEDAVSRAANPIPRMEGSMTVTESGLENNPEMRSWAESLFGKSEMESGSKFFWTMMREGDDKKSTGSEETNG